MIFFFFFYHKVKVSVGKYSIVTTKFSISDGRHYRTY